MNVQYPSPDYKSKEQEPKGKISGSIVAPDLQKPEKPKAPDMSGKGPDGKIVTNFEISESDPKKKSNDPLVTANKNVKFTET